MNNKNVNVVSDSNTDSSKEDFKNDDENLFDEDINDQVKAIPQTTINTKVVWANEISKLHMMMMPTQLSSKQHKIKVPLKI